MSFFSLFVACALLLGKVCDEEAIVAGEKDRFLRAVTRSKAYGGCHSHVLRESTAEGVHWSCFRRFVTFLKAHPVAASCPSSCCLLSFLLLLLVLPPAASCPSSCCCLSFLLQLPVLPPVASCASSFPFFFYFVSASHSQADHPVTMQEALTLSNLQEYYKHLEDGPSARGTAYEPSTISMLTRNFSVLTSVAWRMHAPPPGATEQDQQKTASSPSCCCLLFILMLPVLPPAASCPSSCCFLSFLLLLPVLPPAASCPCRTSRSMPTPSCRSCGVWAAACAKQWLPKGTGRS